MSNDEMKFVHPLKWRETCDLFSLNYRAFRPTEILGYPHAGNDVFHVKGIYKEKEVTAYIKVARQKGAAIQNEAAILEQLNLPYVPEIIDFDFDTVSFLVTLEMPGKRLSVILGDNTDMASLAYMGEYGETLGRIHSIKAILAYPVADRKFFHAPSREELGTLGLTSLAEFFEKKPENTVTVFCHGDFHYANILWENGQVSCILDFELAGYGNRDFDIAWAMALRPGQKFFKTEAEQQLFLNGYAKYGQYDIHAVKYYMAQIYVHFLKFSGDDKVYCEYVRSWLHKNCGFGCAF